MLQKISLKNVIIIIIAKTQRKPFNVHTINKHQCYEKGRYKILIQVIGPLKEFNIFLFKRKLT